MTDYVTPSGVRVADADRVRLGAHLADGTTVMHEGFVNFNAGTLGHSMVEGRISAGVVVGDGSDVGGGSSIMGTLSGGGNEVISIGERCLLGANAGIGISLGDDCTVEAGLYVTAGTLITLPDGDVVKGRDLNHANGLLFRRNSKTGTVEALPRSGNWAGSTRRCTRTTEDQLAERLRRGPQAAGGGPRERDLEVHRLPRRGTATSGSSPITNAAGSSVTARPLRTRSRMVEMSLISNAVVRSRPAAANARSEMIRVPQPGGVSASGSSARSASVTHSRAASGCSVAQISAIGSRRERRQLDPGRRVVQRDERQIERALGHLQRHRQRPAAQVADTQLDPRMAVAELAQDPRHADP